MAAILLIDDDAPVRAFLRDVLVMAGHCVHEASDGDSGLAALRADTPDLVVCDLFMPGREGIETIREIRRAAPAVPVIAISGGGKWGLLDTLDGAAALGALVALPKPISPILLKRVVGELVAGQPAHRGICPNAPEGTSERRICPILRTCDGAGTSIRCGALSRRDSA